VSIKHFIILLRMLEGKQVSVLPHKCETRNGSKPFYPKLNEGKGQRSSLPCSHLIPPAFLVSRTLPIPTSAFLATGRGGERRGGAKCISKVVSLNSHPAVQQSESRNTKIFVQNRQGIILVFKKL
jgi:hypothetical protein